MKFVIAIHGTRGDVEPGGAVGLELLRRGHEVRIAVPPDLMGLMEPSGLPVSAYGPDSRQQLDESLNPWRVQNPVALLRSFEEYMNRAWTDMSTPLVSLAQGADLVVTGTNYREVAANVAEHYGIPYAAVHPSPVRIGTGKILPMVPAPLTRSAMSTAWWLYWRMTKHAQDAQRRDLGLPPAPAPSVRRVEEWGSVEIQAYDELFFPGLAAELTSRRPIVGALTMGLGTETDDEVMSWIDAGKPPIYFGFGSTPGRSPVETVAMITATCAQLGERALIGIGGAHLGDTVIADHVMTVRSANFAAVFPRCRALVHHGGGGTTAAGMRAGVPTLILWVQADQPMWAAQVKRLGVGASRRLASVTPGRLVAGLGKILTPEYAAHARDVASRMSDPAANVAAAVDLLEEAARRRP